MARIDVAGSSGEGDTSPTHHDVFLQTVGIKRRAMPKSNAPGQAHLERSSKSPATYVVQVMLASGGPGWAMEAQAAVGAWEDAFDKMGLSIDVKLVSPQKAVVKVQSVTTLKKVTLWLSQQPLVHWVQEKQDITLRNSHASKAIQSVDASSHAVWNHGITGSGQIVGVADTGIDYDSCYFRDAQMPTPPRCSGTGHVTTTGCINQNHRKIVTYRKFLDSDYSDYNGGHGTHVVGSIAGSSLAANTIASEVLVHMQNCIRQRAFACVCMC
jgi:subtilisin family serine protease